MVASTGLRAGPPPPRQAIGAHGRRRQPARGSGGGCLTFSQIAPRFAPLGLAPATFSGKKNRLGPTIPANPSGSALDRLPRFLKTPAFPKSRSPGKGSCFLRQIAADYGRDLKLTGGSGCGMVDRVINKPGGRPMRPFPKKTGSPSVSVSEAPATPTGF